MREILPVECLDVEDLCESTEGFRAEACQPNHPVLDATNLATMPPILGYNIVRARQNCDVLAVWQDGRPMLAVGQFGKGRVLAYTSDPAPHWGCNFVYWDGYARFWLNACNWLTASP